MKNIVRIFCIVSILFSLSVSNAFSQITFTDFDMNDNGDLLFVVKSETYNGKEFDTLFLKNHNSAGFEQLTFFPEAVESFDNGAILQIMNRFGLLTVDVNTGRVIKDSVFSNFDLKAKSNSRMFMRMQTSPNSRWVSFVEAKSGVLGKLVLYDTKINKQFTLSENVPLNAKPVLWAADSSAFIYEVNSILYFARPSWLSQTKTKPLCKLGEGNISAIKWLKSGDFLFVSGSSVYRISSTEILTRVLYNSLVSIGQSIGNLPFAVNPADDDLFISETGKSILFVRNKRHVYLLKADSNSLKFAAGNNIIPYLLLPETTAFVDVFWKKEIPIISVSGIESGKKTFQTWTLGKDNFKKLEELNKAEILSANPAGTHIAVKTNRGLEIYDIGTEKTATVVHTKNIISSCWGNDNIFFAGTDNAVLKVNTKTNSVDIITLSEVEDFSWDKTGKTVLAASVEDATGMKTNVSKIIKYAGDKKWILADDNEKKLNKKNSRSLNYRVYVDSGFGDFKNMIFVRSLNENSTVSLISENIKAPTKKTDFSKTIQQQKGVFSNGNRLNNKIALVFDVMQTTEGLAQVLYILDKYNIKATFFINGEAIGANPKLISEIPAASHQCGSMFFSTWNFSDSNYRIDGNFIRAGLARNEDNFYNATGYELSLIWHSPFYILSPTILEAGRWAGYTFIVPDIQVPDWITSENNNSHPKLYKPSLEIIADILDTVKNGSIIPIYIGKTGAPRADYLYTSLELLIIALLEEGYEITTVGNLMQSQ
ncbi:MAG: hypothetical protein CR988_07510 [Treponema sp.]|nr:MAG: hypothetical protein CR988_07510 [Treponema sp.]